MQDTNSNGKVDRVVRYLLRVARCLHGRHRPLDARERPQRRHVAPSPSPSPSPPSRSPKAPAHPTPPSAPSRSLSPTTPPGSATPPATYPPSPPPAPRQRQAGPRRLHARDERHRRKRQSRPCQRRPSAIPLAASTDTPPGRSPTSPAAARLASVSTAGATATLAISEGAGAANTAVGTFKVVLAAAPPASTTPPATSPRFASTAPADQATPILVSLRDAGHQCQRQGRPCRSLPSPNRSLPTRPAPPPGRSRTSPAAARLASVAVAGATPRSRSPKAPVHPTPPSAPSRSLSATSATGIRDAAGNQSSFAATAPTDSAKPVLVAGTLVMKDIDGNGKVDRVSADLHARPLAASTDTAPWTLTNVPCGGTLASVSTAGATATLTINEGAGAANTAVGTFKVVLAAAPPASTTPPATYPRFASTAPADQATPILVSLRCRTPTPTARSTMSLATFSETLAAYRAGTAPWTLANVPSGGTPRLRHRRRRHRHAHDHRRRRRTRHRRRRLHDRPHQQPHRHPRRCRQPILLRRHHPHRQRQAGPRRRHARDERHRRQRQSRPCQRRASRDTARRLHRHRPLDAHQRPQRRQRWPRSPPPGATATLTISRGRRRRRTLPSAPSTSSLAAARPASTTPPATFLARLDRPRRPGDPHPRQPGDAGHERNGKVDRVARHLLRVARRLHGRHRPVDARERPLGGTPRLRLRLRRRRHPHDHRRRRRPRHRRRRLHGRSRHDATGSAMPPATYPPLRPRHPPTAPTGAGQRYVREQRPHGRASWRLATRSIVTFSESIATAVGPATTITETDPTGSGNDG